MTIEPFGTAFALSIRRYFEQMNDASSRSPLASHFMERDIEFLDRVLQNLFGLGLKLEYCLSVLDDAPAQARTGMEGVLSGLDEMAEPIREEIQNRGRWRKLAP